ncbi:MAG TPA: hypothetical protein VNI54_00425 [Thermoanaerobaculia bacterium]|nr:hypothetical protein [Thermoanaerobaculia bacterium]
MNDEQRAPLSAGKLMGGLVLLTIGLAGITHSREIWQYWPVLLIGLGVGHEADTLRTRRGDGGYILIAIGVWMLAGSVELFGLSYRSAFPLAIVIAGAGMILHALLGVTKEKNREQQ